MVNPEKSGSKPKAARLKGASERERERQKRLQAIDLIFGMWKGRTEIPIDGLEFQEELRDEWKRP